MRCDLMTMSEGRVDMRSRWNTILALLAVISGLLVLQVGCTPATVQSQAADEAEQRTISVSGSGTVSATPDEVVLRLGVETRAETASEAMSQNSEQMTAVINSLEEAGVPPENIQTQTVQLRPQYETPEREPGPAQERELVGYVASNIVEARTGDLDAVGELLDAAVQAGANRVEGLQFEVSDPVDLLVQARDAAWEDAEAKAEQLADLAEAELGDVLSINESTSAPRLVAREAVEMEAAVPIQPGTEDIRVDLQVTWLLR